MTQSKSKVFLRKKTQDNINACEFELSRKTGITEKEISIPKSARIYTEIELTDINPKYKQATARFTQEYIADSILEHCLLYYLSEDAPVIEVTEDGETINLTNQFNPHDFVKHTEKKKILKYNFTCYYIKNSKIKSHEYFLCAHNRKVKSRRIDSIFPIFTSKVVENDEEYWLQTYVVSNYLDDRVNISRSEIVFPKVKDDDSEDGTIKFGQETRTVIIEKDIDKLVIDGLTTQYAELIDERKQYLQNKVNKFVNSDEGLEYRTLDVDDDFLTSIPDTADEKKLDDIFHEQQYKKYKEIRKKRERLLNKDFSRKKDYQALLKDVVTLTTREGNARLAQYVSHRKTIIDLLERYLEWCEEKNNYKDEATLHNLIFVMGADQNITPYDAHNLWILDDRLSFHRYIYSDKSIKSHSPKKKKTDSNLETDIAIYDVFDTNYLYGEKNDYEEVASAVVFEFKRPDRNITYEEFSKQMREQIQAINEGKIKDKNHKHVLTSDKTPVFFYYVCDVNAYTNLKKSAIYEGFTETPYKSLIRLSNNVYQEILTYQTLIVNARRRNKAFFKKLGIE